LELSSNFHCKKVIALFTGKQKTMLSSSVSFLLTNCFRVWVALVHLIFLLNIALLHSWFYAFK